MAKEKSVKRFKKEWSLSRFRMPASWPGIFTILTLLCAVLAGAADSKWT